MVKAQDGRVVMGLADAGQISDQVVYSVPQFQSVLPLMDGERSVDEIVAEIGQGLARPMLEGFIAQLDAAGLLYGPTFDVIWEKVKTDFDGSDVLPQGATAAFADAIVEQELGEAATDEKKAELGPDRLRAVFDQWIDKALEEAEDPSFDALPKAIVAPHIDYPRGWLNYASVWGRLRVVDRPDRVVILGTNHHGRSTGVCGCNKGYESPLGVCPLDEPLATRLGDELGEAFYADRYDHEREHSIELQIPWIQHCLGTDDDGAYCPVLGVLVHDPAVNNGESYDGQGVALQPFVDAMKKSLADLGGTTLVVVSADLSHVGSSFGDKEPLAGETDEAKAFRDKIVAHDREMLEMIARGEIEQLVASMAWQQNPTRWCSTGCLTAGWQIVEPDEVKLMTYTAAMDPEGRAMVSSASLVML